MKSVLLFGLVALASCRPAQRDGGDVKSLDNFTRADSAEVKLNQCGMNLESMKAVPAKQKQRAARILASSDPLKLATLSALTAIPDGLTEPFFAAGGTIEVTPNAVDLCNDLPLGAAERRFAGEAKKEVKTCWRQDKGGKPPVIYVKADPAVIRHSLLRAFAFLYGELFVARLDAMIEAKLPFGKGALQVAADYRKATQAVGNALIADLAKPAPAIQARLKQYKKDDAAQYDRIATSEALDSYYCAPATQLAFRQGYPQTYRAFVGSTQKGLAASFGTPWFQ